MSTCSIFEVRVRGVVSVAVLCWVIGNAGSGFAVEFNFEGPTYSPGTVIGQDGWVTNGYIPGDFFGGPNGDFDISTDSPLAGSQSLRFEQTAVTGGGGSPGASDISKPEVLAISSGLEGPDLVVSYQYSAISKPSIDPSTYGGLFATPDGFNGYGPIFVEFRGSEIVSGQNFAVIPFDDITYFEGDVLDVKYEVDFDAEQVTYRFNNLTTGDPEVAHTLGFMAGWGPEGPNGEYLVDIGILGRRGIVKYDNLTIDPGTGPVITELNWAGNASGDWNAPGNWSPSAVPGGRQGVQTAIFGDAITSPQTIFTNNARVLNGVRFDNANSYLIAGTGSIELRTDTSGGTPVDPTIQVDSGDHQFQVALNLQSDTTITVAAGASLTFNNQINLGGNTLTASGDVTINHSIVGGGTVVGLGALGTSGAADIGGDLLSTGTLVVDVGPGSADLFHILGDATLSGVLDVVLSPGALPSGPFTVLTAGGVLDATELSLHSSDVGSFALSTSGNDLLLTYVGGAVPEPTSCGLVLLGVAASLFVRPGRAMAKKSLLAIALFTGLAITQSAEAQLFDFENPPYTPGTVVGQQGWNTNGYIFADPFFGGVVNGTVEVSPTGAISGGQSLLYTQTDDPPGSGGPGGSDVGQLYALFGTEDGTDAIDLAASVKLQADAGALADGLVGFGLSPGGGRSPLFVNIRNVNGANGTGEIIVGDALDTPVVAPYEANDVIEFRFGVDFDTETYEVFATNITQGTPEQQLLGSGTNGRIPFFFGTAGDDGDGVTHTMDVHVVLRSGVSRVDDVELMGDEFTRAVWRSNTSGEWQQNEGWIPRMVPGIEPGAQVAVFGTAITSPQTVFTNSAVTVGAIEFDNGNKYAIAGSGSVNLTTNTSGPAPVNPTVNVASGSHEFQVAVNILENTTVTVAEGSALDFNNVVNLGGKTLTTSGAVDLNVGVTGGGTISSSGALGTAGATPIAANINSTGELVIDLGTNNTDFFDITGNATLSGLLDVVLEAGFAPSGSYTVLTASGALNAAGLTLDPSDAGLFSLAVSGQSLVLTASAGVIGDYSGNGVVDAADYTIWRDNLGTNNTLLNNPIPGLIGAAHYTQWKANFGATGGGGSVASAVVPEPASILLGVLTMAVCGLVVRSRARNS